MECPRCGGKLDHYRLGDREAYVCEECGYIGIPVEHRGEERQRESWDDALSRFHEVDRRASVTVETDPEDPTPDFIDVDEPPAEELTPAFVPLDDGAGPSGDATKNGVECRVCGMTFDSRAQLNGHLATHSKNGS